MREELIRLIDADPIMLEAALEATKLEDPALYFEIEYSQINTRLDGDVWEIKRALYAHAMSEIDWSEVAHYYIIKAKELNQ